MESTAGLADGNTYIGDINLKSKMAYQADISFTYQPLKAMIAPHVVIKILIITFTIFVFIEIRIRLNLTEELLETLTYYGNQNIKYHL